MIKHVEFNHRKQIYWFNKASEIFFSIIYLQIKHVKNKVLKRQQTIHGCFAAKTYVK